VRHNDYWFSVFLEKLSELGLERNTLIVFMADHGEHLGEHDLWSHNPPSYVQVLHTPLLMVCPDLVPANIVVDQNVQNLDIMPTVLDLAGVPTQGLLMQGTSLVPSFDGRDEFLEKRAVLAEEALLKTSREVSQPYGSVLFRQWHLLHSVYVQMRVFDLTTDPMELSGKRPSRELRRNTLQFLQDVQRAELDIWCNVTGGEVTDVALDPETVSELKALGYLE
jgi:arylsulfatase A-like enzyme